MTQGEFNGLWSAYRIRKLETLLEGEPQRLRAYLRNPNMKPVCGWRSVEARDAGVMTAANARIDKAEDQRRLFQFRRGDRHSPQSIQKMRKPKSDNTKKKMREAAMRRHERARGESK